MGRIEDLFRKKGSRVLNIYCTAGFPQLNDTIKVLEALQNNGADIIELGMPYSDPLADGAVIQASSARAIQNGMNIPLLFSQLEKMREKIHIPVILMGYLNPVLQYGFQKFCEQAKRVGVDGLIMPDVPVIEYEKEYRSVLEKNGLDFIFLVLPETSGDRVRKLDSLSSGFLYAVSSSSLTGSDKTFTSVEDYLKRLNQLGLKNPLLVGFGIRDHQSFETVCRYANGAIIGSAYVKAIEHTNDINATTKDFINGILNNAT